MRVTVPNSLSNFARIKIEAVGNIFFDISNTDFTVGEIVAPTYCTSEGNDPSEDYIGNVTLGSIHNTSTADDSENAYTSWY